MPVIQRSNARENVKSEINDVLLAESLASRGKDVTEDVSSAVGIVADACRAGLCRLRGNSFGEPAVYRYHEDRAVAFARHGGHSGAVCCSAVPDDPPCGRVSGSACALPDFYIPCQCLALHLGRQRYCTRFSGLDNPAPGRVTVFLPRPCADLSAEYVRQPGDFCRPSVCPDCPDPVSPHVYSAPSVKTPL